MVSGMISGESCSLPLMPLEAVPERLPEKERDRTSDQKKTGRITAYF